MGKNKCEAGPRLWKIKEGGVNVFCGSLVPRTEHRHLRSCDLEFFFFLEWNGNLLGCDLIYCDNSIIS